MPVRKALIRRAEIIFLLVIRYRCINGIGAIANVNRVVEDIADIYRVWERIFDRIYPGVVAEFIGANLVPD